MALHCSGDNTSRFAVSYLRSIYLHTHQTWIERSTPTSWMLLVVVLGDTSISARVSKWSLKAKYEEAKKRKQVVTLPHSYQDQRVFGSFSWRDNLLFFSAKSLDNLLRLIFDLEFWNSSLDFYFCRNNIFISTFFKQIFAFFLLLELWHAS